MAGIAARVRECDDENSLPDELENECIGESVEIAAPNVFVDACAGLWIFTDEFEGSFKCIHKAIG